MGYDALWADEIAASRSQNTENDTRNQFIPFYFPFPNISKSIFIKIEAEVNYPNIMSNVLARWKLTSFFVRYSMALNLAVEIYRQSST